VIRTYFNFLILLLLYFLIGSSYAGLYDDWPDEAICLWLEQRPDHEGYLEENEKRGLNCFEREDFHPRDFVHEPLNLKMY
jgi:hypothetical protein